MDAEKKLGTNRYWIAVAIILLALFIAVFYYLPSLQGERQTPPQQEEQITLEQFMATVKGAPALAVVQDLRTAPDNESKQAVQSCGVNLARSLGSLGKNVTNYAYAPGDICYTYAGETKMVEACEGGFKGTYVLVVSYGTASSKFYRERAFIATNKYYGANCFISFEATEEPTPTPNALPEVDPDATAKTANMTIEQLDSLCTVRDYCSNFTTADERDSCLMGLAFQSYGDPRCCFSVQNSSNRDQCIRATAVATHGIKEDYCQFVVSPEVRNECYYKYGVGLTYPPYCDKIADAAMNSTCYSDALAAAAEIVNSQATSPVSVPQ